MKSDLRDTWCPSDRGVIPGAPEPTVAVAAKPKENETVRRLE
jgi:hypothetical protein